MASQLRLPLLASRASSYNKVLDWMHFAYMGDRTGSCVMPASMDLILSFHTEGGRLFIPSIRWQSMPCKRSGKIQEDARDLALRVLDFLFPYGAS